MGGGGALEFGGRRLEPSQRQPPQQCAFLPSPLGSPTHLNRVIVKVYRLARARGCAGVCDGNVVVGFRALFGTRFVGGGAGARVDRALVICWDP